MSDRLAGTVALVTGASSGIGAATAIALAAQGATVALAARRGERLSALAAQIAADGGRALECETDLTREGEPAALVAHVVAELGRLDTLVNNAGLMLLGPADEAPLEEWERMVTLNVAAVLRCAHAALPHLLAAAEDSPRGVSDMVNVSSTAGRQVKPGSGVYNLTKHGLGAFSESLRMEVSRRHLRVSLIEPGATDTELRDHLRPAIRERQRERFASMEALTAGDVAESILHIVTRPRHVMINEILIRPTDQND
ncbi:MAG TPA: SDR family NAD(P)-dependent oxidoreductase [Solirubrobacteraceae bacterium]|nr:SDR family NAD(P)-dependent oxidoreductase [Solirubrobacteraceae bacterium]